MKKHTLRAVAFGLAATAMGVTMPACPGQQAMQEQLDAMKTQQTSDSKKLQALDASVKGMAADMATLKTAAGLMGDMGGQVKAMGTELTALEAEVKALKEAPKASAGAKGKKRK